METKVKLLSKEQLELLKKEVDRQLEVRCINVKTKLTFENGKFELTSTNFQTIPMLHTNLSIINFGGDIEEDKKIQMYLTFGYRFTPIMMAIVLVYSAYLPQ